MGHFSDRKFYVFRITDANSLAETDTKLLKSVRKELS